MKQLLTFDSQELIIFLSAIPVMLMSFIFWHRKVLKTLRDGVDFNSKHFMIGLSVAISTSIAFINWTTEESFVDYITSSLDLDPIETVQTPVTRHPKKKVVPPPPAPKKLEPPKNLTKLLLVTEPIQATSEEDLIDEQDVLVSTMATEAASTAPAPIVAPVIEEDDSKVITISDQMPRFPGCEHLDAGPKEKELCSKQALLEYIYSRLDYPLMAKSNRIEGMVVIQFVVSKKGKVTDVKIARDIGAGCGKAAAAAVIAMNELPEDWIPGHHRGKTVNVKYTLPIRFKLH